MLTVQLLALFVMDTSKGIPGFAGVFVACVFSAALRSADMVVYLFVCQSVCLFVQWHSQFY